MIGIVIYLVASIAFGSIICLFGNKIYFHYLIGTVFVLTFGFCLQMLGLSFKDTIYAILWGGTAVFLTIYLRKIHVFLVGAFAGGMLGELLSGFLPSGEFGNRWVLILCLSLLTAIMAVKMGESFMMLCTAYSGASLMSFPICFLLLEFGNLQNFAYVDGITATMLHLNYYLKSSFVLEEASLLCIVTFTLSAIGFFFQKGFIKVKCAEKLLALAEK